MKILSRKQNSGPVQHRACSGAGFTLVETLVGLAIFTVSILALMSVLASSISSTTYAKQKLTAEYLGQEGIEYMRNVRDTFVLYDASGADAGWSNFKTYLSNNAAQCNGPSGCYFDDSNIIPDWNSDSQPITQMDVFMCNGNCPNLKYDSTSGKYGYVSGVDSGFSRRILLAPFPPGTPLSSANEIVITSIVYWNQGSAVRNVTYKENLFNWVE